MLLTSIQSKNISFICQKRSESRKLMGICRFENKDILVFRSRLSVL